MDLAKHFDLVDYARHYADFLDGHPAKKVAIAELFIFRAWTTHLCFRIFSSRQDIAERITTEVWNLANTLGRAMLKLKHQIDFDEVLRGDYIAIADSRWQEYDAIFVLHHDTQDKLAAMNLCLRAVNFCGFGNNPTKVMWLALDFFRQMAQIKDEAIQYRIAA